MSKNYLIRGSVSRIVRGQSNISKVAFFKVLDKLKYMTEFATDKMVLLTFPERKVSRTEG